MGATGIEAQRVQQFDVLYGEYFAEIAAYCRWRSRSIADADDAVAEVFTILWRKLDSVPSGRAARAWLYATARRVTANQLRAERRRASLVKRLTTMRSAPVAGEALTGDDVTTDLVRRALQALRQADQEVLLLSEWQELSSAQIAEVLGCTAGAVRGRLHRARRRFRVAFDLQEAQIRSCDRMPHTRTDAPQLDRTDS